MTFHSVGNGIIIPTDELIFFRGVGLYHQPVFDVSHRFTSCIYCIVHGRCHYHISTCAQIDAVYINIRPKLLNKKTPTQVHNLDCWKLLFGPVTNFLWNPLEPRRMRGPFPWGRRGPSNGTSSVAWQRFHRPKQRQQLI